MSNDMVIIGSGGKGGGGGGGGATEAPNSLRSKQYARVLDLICEGEIVGLVNGLKSVYLEGTPLQNADGTYNFKDVVVDSRTGTQSQGYIPGFNAVESITDVSVEVTNAISVTRPIADLNVDAVRVTITVPQLSNQDTTNGNLNGSSVDIAIDVQIGTGGFVQKVADSIVGKTMSPYQRSYRVDLPGAGPWDIRVRRVSVDAPSANIQNKTVFSNYTTLIDQKLRYPNSALVGVSIDAQQFSSVPNRGYDVKLLKVSVPSNYFPETRAYTRNALNGLDTGVAQTWDGTFYLAWTDNPAWCWYDMVTNDRYGLGQYVIDSIVDKWQLYTIGKYCDVLVPNGFGGTEPRFTCNIYLQTREEAYTIINLLASIFRGLSFWTGGGMTATQDSPSDPVALFTPANVVNGIFNYSGSDIKARHTVALVTWNDPAEGYTQKIEYVEDYEGIVRYGVVETEIAAVGCTSRGQAHRVGKWLLYTERMQTEIVTFRVGIEGAPLYPGAVIKTQDPSRAGLRLGGRIISGTTTAITVDSSVNIESLKTYTLAIILPNGLIEERTLNNAVGTTSILTTATAFSLAPQPFAVWILAVNDLSPELWRVIAIKDADKTQADIIAIEHQPSKYSLVELGISFEPAQTTLINTISFPPTNLTATAHIGAPGTLDIVVAWASANGTRSAIVTWRRDSENFETAITYANTYTIKSVSLGSYTISVATVNSIGATSNTTTITYNVVSASLLPDVTNLALKQPFIDSYAAFIWNEVASADGYRAEILVGGVVKRTVELTTAWFNYHYVDSKADGAGTPFRSFEFRVKAKYGDILSGNWVTITATNLAPPIPAATLSAISEGIQVSAPLPVESDYAGMQVWVSTTTGFIPNNTNLVYDGVNNSTNILKLTPGIPYYVKLAFYDVFGKTSLNITSQYTVTPLANVADIPVVNVLPAVGPEGKAVYLTTDDKIYRSDGVAWVTWVDGSDILAASVTAGKINVANLSALSASMGTLTAGNITLDAAGFIRGGSTGYLTGTGFWMGYHSGLYKLHIGHPAGQFLAWTGTGLTINAGGTFSGALSAASGSFAGSLSAATGTFGGSLSAATGTFAGTLTAAAVNAVNTINIAGNAVTIPVSSYAASVVEASSNIISLSASLDGTSPALIFMSMSLASSSEAVGTGTLTLYRDGVSIYTSDFTTTPFDPSLGGVDREKLPWAGSITDPSPSAGSHTYTVGLSADIHAWSRSILLLSVKR